MAIDHAATVQTVVDFPEHYFLENLAVRSDNSVLVTVLNHRQLWWVPPFTGAEPVRPVLVHTFERLVTGIVETEPDVFHVSATDGYTTHESSLHRVDLRGWSPGEPVRPETVLTFDERVRALNGSCLIAERTIVLADSFAGLIWRVDLPEDGGPAQARVWLRHPSLDHDPDNPLTPPQPGVNGVRFAPRTKFLYYTSTAQRLFMRVRVDPVTHDPAGEPEFVSGGTMADDFCLDEDAGVAYVTTHRQNTIDRVPLDPRPDGTREIAVGDPFDERVIGPSSAAWGRGPGEYGRVAYVTTDGGTTSPPPDGRIRPARLLRITFS
ncbi:hypothetical protein AB0L00_38190 [Actinoallomurus sp. NPDC052308]|uniref:hypothetical protein n=1 Tax=Actinoallomurus sp. NPDC052308 TaxID=3155530 RepID=UPI0034336F03